jgi:ABC-type glycerol-3-phosphate transport system permease component
MSTEITSAASGRDQSGWHGRILANIPKHLALILASLLVIVPVYFVLTTSLKTTDDYAGNKFGLPTQIFLGNVLTSLRSGRFFLWFANSVILSFGSVIVSTVVSALAAFAFARMRFKINRPLLSVITSLMVIPPVVMIIPIFVMLSSLKLTSTYPGAILIYAGIITPFSIYLLTNFFKSIPHEVVESALIDGASPLGILTRIVLPLSGPALVTLIVVNALWIWNDLLVALVLLPKEDLRTLMVGITVFGSRYNRDVPVAMTGMLLASLPMFVLYLFGQRYFIRGLLAGALKG